MNNNSLNAAKNKGGCLIKRLPRGWTAQVIKRVQEANATQSSGRQIPSDRGSIYSVAKRLSIRHPLWPFIVEVAEKERIPLKIFQQREEQLNLLLST